MLAGMTAMSLLGAVFFAAMGALVDWRIGTPLVPQDVTATGESPTGPPLAILHEGLRQSVTIAAQNLGWNRRSDAVHALDAATRAADVGKHAASGDTADAFARASRELELARRNLQDGKKARAQEVLAALATSLAIGPRLPEEWEAALQPAVNLEQFEEARVLNAQGVRLGEVQRVDGQMLTLRVGMSSDVLGFIDWGGGKEIIVPAYQLVFGKRKGLGSTMVVLPTFSASAPEVQAQYLAQR